MEFLSGVVVFMIIWWTVIFAVLPWGNARAEQTQAGNEPGAPANPRIVKKMLITTGITIVLWAIAMAVIQSDRLSIRDWAREMPLPGASDGTPPAASGQ
jgi:predicted secreted protein